MTRKLVVSHKKDKIMIVYYKSNVRTYRLAAYHHCKLWPRGCFQEAAGMLYQLGLGCFAGAEKGNEFFSRKQQTFSVSH